MKEKLRVFISKILRIYKVVIYNEHLEEKLKFTLSPMNLILFFSLMVVLSFLLAFLLFAYTPIKEIIPGFSTVAQDPSKLYEVQLKADSLEHLVKAQEKQLNVLKKILRGEALDSPAAHHLPLNNNAPVFRFISNTEKENRLLNDSENTLHNAMLFTPAKGYITAKYEPASEHYAVDIITAKNAAVKSVADGVVIFSEWSSSTGHVIVVQHSHNLISIYKHNSVLLKKAGNFVRSGDVIALVGSSGELTTGPHLHFELWHKGSPVNPEDYINF